MKRFLCYRYWLLGTVALLLVAGSFTLAWYFTPPATAINRANALKIKPGMTLAEVEAILGGPARNETNRQRLGATYSVALRPGEPVPPQREHNWQSNRYWVHIRLDANGRVDNVECRPLRGYWISDNWLDRVEEWFASWLEG